MLKKFTLKNYKNFKDEICIDFENIADYQFSTNCITDGVITKMLIYGRNATGKTNLGKALMDIKSLLQEPMRYTANELFLNADSKEETAIFSYAFEFGSKELIYKYARFSNQELQNEELIIDGKTIFKFDFSAENYNYDNLKCIGAETVNVKRYLESLNIDRKKEGILERKQSLCSQLPFLRWLINNAVFKNTSVLNQFANYVLEMTMISGNKNIFYSGEEIDTFFYKMLNSPGELQDFEEFLKIMGIECRLVLKALPNGQEKLYFGHDKLMPFFENASSGTLALAGLYFKIIFWTWHSTFIYLDEFDAFYHYEMAENVIKFLKEKYPLCQIIMTSHNTNLMTNRLMRPDCMFILSRKGTLTSLCNATQRELREGHNLEKMYISGEFERYE